MAPGAICSKLMQCGVIERYFVHCQFPDRVASPINQLVQVPNAITTNSLSPIIQTPDGTLFILGPTIE